MLTLCEKRSNLNPMLAKSSIGILTPEMIERTDAMRLFLCLRILTHTQNVLFYGNCAGLPSGRLVPQSPVVRNPVQFPPLSDSHQKGRVYQYQIEDNTMPPLSVCDKSISIRNNLYSLNDLHRAAGGDKNQQPANFLRLEQTQALIAEIDKVADSQLKSSDMRISHEVIRGALGGTYVCRELVYAYAMWISPKFNLAVIRAFDQLQTQNQPPQLNEQKPNHSLVVWVTLQRAGQAPETNPLDAKTLFEIVATQHEYILIPRSLLADTLKKLSSAQSAAHNLIQFGGSL